MPAGHCRAWAYAPRRVGRTRWDQQARSKPTQTRTQTRAGQFRPPLPSSGQPCREMVYHRSSSERLLSLAERMMPFRLLTYAWKDAQAWAVQGTLAAVADRETEAAIRREQTERSREPDQQGRRSPAGHEAVREK